MIARLHRAGAPTAVWIPDDAREGLRDLTRARDDMKHLQRQAKQSLCVFCFAMANAIAEQATGLRHIINGWKSNDSGNQFFLDGHGTNIRTAVQPTGEFMLE